MALILYKIAVQISTRLEFISDLEELHSVLVLCLATFYLHLLTSDMLNNAFTQREAAKYKDEKFGCINAVMMLHAEKPSQKEQRTGSELKAARCLSSGSLCDPPIPVTAAFSPLFSRLPSPLAPP